MPRKRTYVDSGVLIWAVAAPLPERTWGTNALSDPARTYVFSDLVWLETIPKMEFSGHHAQADDARAFLGAMEPARADLSRVLSLAIEIATRDGLGPLDAMHVATAKLSWCSEMLTTEKPGTSLHRARDVRVVYVGGRG